MSPTIASLCRYPIKSCGGIEEHEVPLTEFGLEYDREWMLVGQNNQFLSQRVHPELALVATKIEGDKLLVTAPRVGELAIALERDPGAATEPVEVWKKPGTATSAGLEAAEFFSTYLGRAARLLRIAGPRQVKPECQVTGASSRTAFADGFPLLIASLSSLAELNRHLAEPIGIDRFRANVIIDGAPAYDEDYWRGILLGRVGGFVVRACARCPVPNVKNGALPKVRPVTAALRATRQGIDPVGESRGEFFGQNVVHVYEPGALLRVGDAVRIMSRATHRNILQQTQV
ncbi:MAG TPA: MOSC N-terminal beta barrel domain-containing protein [Candidatus Saccharimonadales bacterium]|nr:MOSC N-terminal beta barrel domain-containing protein [Candidatus Saccharimonadales bacterium]